MKKASASRVPEEELDPSEAPTEKIWPRSRLTERDNELIAILGEAFLLPAKFIRRLFFLGASGDTAMWRRLRALCDARVPCIRRIVWPDFREGMQHAFMLTPEGLAAAEKRLGRSVPFRPDIDPQYFDHHFLMTELFVGLLEVRVKQLEAKYARSTSPQDIGKVYATSAHPEFRWQVLEQRKLSFQQVRNNELAHRNIVPDAILELPRLKRRIFIESETGSHPVKSSKPGATTSKIESYAAFCSPPQYRPDQPSFYAQRYKDGFRPEVWFLVRHPIRRANVEAAIRDREKQGGGLPCGFYAADPSATLRVLREQLWPPRRPVLEPPE